MYATLYVRPCICQLRGLLCLLVKLQIYPCCANIGTANRSEQIEARDEMGVRGRPHSIFSITIMLTLWGNAPLSRNCIKTGDKGNMDYHLLAATAGPFVAVCMNRQKELGAISSI